MYTDTHTSLSSVCVQAATRMYSSLPLLTYLPLDREMYDNIYIPCSIDQDGVVH